MGQDMKRGRSEQRFNPFDRDPWLSSRDRPRTEGVAPWGSNHANLTEELIALASYVSVSTADEKEREQCVCRLKGVVSTFWAGATLEAFGSWPAGLSMLDGDIDLRLIGGPPGTSGLRRLDNALRQQTWVRSTRPLLHARVPIVTYEDNHTGLSVDVSAGSGDGPRTTAFLRQCIESCACFRPVVLCLKLLLGQHALNKAFTGGVSSYRLCIMVAAFLETTPGCHITAAGPLLLGGAFAARTQDSCATSTVLALLWRSVNRRPCFPFAASAAALRLRGRLDDNALPERRRFQRELRGGSIPDMARR